MEKEFKTLSEERIEKFTIDKYYESDFKGFYPDDKVKEFIKRLKELEYDYNEGFITWEEFKEKRDNLTGDKLI